MLKIEIIGTHLNEDGSVNMQGGSVHHTFVGRNRQEIMEGLEAFLLGAGFIVNELGYVGPCGKNL